MGDIVKEKSARNKLDLQQEIIDYSEFLKINRRKSRKYQVLLECVFECIEDNDLDPELRHKIKKIIVSEQVSQIQLCADPVKSEAQNLLGLPVSNITLTYTESNTLRSLLKHAMDSKWAKTTNESKLFSAVHNPKQESPLDLAYNDRVLLEYRNKLALEQEQYLNNQMQLFHLLEEMAKFRLETVPELTDVKYSEYESEIQLNYAKMQLATTKSTVDIFMESSHSLRAFAEMISDLNDQKRELSQQIDKLQDLKKKYDDVSCNEYNDILKSYLQYKSALEKRKLMQALWK